jgi:hypothetical protein
MIPDMDDLFVLVILLDVFYQRTSGFFSVACGNLICYHRKYWKRSKRTSDLDNLYFEIELISSVNLMMAFNSYPRHRISSKVIVISWLI